MQASVNMRFALENSGKFGGFVLEKRTHREGVSMGFGVSGTVLCGGCDGITACAVVWDSAFRLSLLGGSAFARTLPPTLSEADFVRRFVARTERSIINWCQPNKLGVPRLDPYFDPNERRYFITSQSVELAIKEEQAKAAKSGNTTESSGNVPQASETNADALLHAREASEDAAIKTLEREMRDLKITNQAKDYYIDRLEKEREGFVEKLMISSHRVGELEAKLLQLEAPQKREEPKAEHLVNPERAVQ